MYRERRYKGFIVHSTYMTISVNCALTRQIKHIDSFAYMRDYMICVMVPLVIHSENAASHSMNNTRIY